MVKLSKGKLQQVTNFHCIASLLCKFYKKINATDNVTLIFFSWQTPDISQQFAGSLESK